jgi:hypothetical protein
VLRLALLLWRLRRATAIETDLLRIQAEILRDRRLGRFPERPLNAPPPILRVPACNIQDREETNDDSAPLADGSYYCHAPRQTPQPVSSARQLTLCLGPVRPEPLIKTPPFGSLSCDAPLGH